MLDRLARKLVGSIVEPTPDISDEDRRRRARDQELKRRAARAPSADFRDAMGALPADPEIKALDWLVVEKTAVSLLARHMPTREDAARAVTERMRQPMIRAIIRRYAKEGRREDAIAKLIALGA